MTRHDLARALEEARPDPRATPTVAVAYHAREHAATDRPEFVLVQGVASFDRTPDRAWLESIAPEWERFLGPKQTGLAGRWLDVYYWQRVAIEIDVRRVLVWPTGDCAGEPEVFGEPLPAAHRAPQRAPRNGTRPANRPAGSLATIDRLPHALLGWVGADGAAEVVPVTVTGADGEAPTWRRPPRRASRRAGAAPASPRTRSSRGWSARSSASTRAG